MCRILDSMEQQEVIKARFARVAKMLDERARRAVAASEALAIGWGGITAVSRATGLSRTVIQNGIKELAGTRPGAAPGRIRRPGGGRKKTMETDQRVRTDLEQRVLPVTRGDPESPLRWTCKSVRKLAAELCERGHRVSPQWVAERRRDLGDSLQATRKTREGSDHPDRDAQFRHIHTTAEGLSFSGRPGDARWRPRRKNWWVISRTAGASGTHRGSRRRCGSTTV